MDQRAPLPLKASRVLTTNTPLGEERKEWRGGKRETVRREGGGAEDQERCGLSKVGGRVGGGEDEERAWRGREEKCGVNRGGGRERGERVGIRRWGEGGVDGEVRGQFRWSPASLPPRQS